MLQLLIPKFLAFAISRNYFLNIVDLFEHFSRTRQRNHTTYLEKKFKCRKMSLKIKVRLKEDQEQN